MRKLSIVGVLVVSSVAHADSGAVDTAIWSSTGTTTAGGDTGMVDETGIVVSDTGYGVDTAVVWYGGKSAAGLAGEDGGNAWQGACSSVGGTGTGALAWVGLLVGLRRRR